MNSWITLGNKGRHWWPKDASAVLPSVNPKTDDNKLVVFLIIITTERWKVDEDDET